MAALCPVAGGYISDKYGWRTQFKILSAFAGVAVLLIILFCPEHAYNRPVIFETDVASTENLTTTAGEKDPEETVKPIPQTEEERATESFEKRNSYVQELKPFNGLVSRQNPFILAARPFACMLYPAVFWGFTVGGLWTAWVSNLPHSIPRHSH